jgi:hypothetical protein
MRYSPPSTRTKQTPEGHSFQSFTQRSQYDIHTYARTAASFALSLSCLWSVNNAHCPLRTYIQGNYDTSSGAVFGVQVVGPTRSQERTVF